MDPELLQRLLAMAGPQPIPYPAGNPSGGERPDPRVGVPPQYLDLPTGQYIDPQYVVPARPPSETRTTITNGFRRDDRVPPGTPGPGTRAVTRDAEPAPGGFDQRLRPVPQRAGFGSSPHSVPPAPSRAETYRDLILADMQRRKAPDAR